MKQKLVIAVFLFTIQTVFGHLNNVCTSYFSYGFKLSDHCHQCSYNPDLFSTTDRIIKNHGYPLENYTVNSGNKFYLKIFRIPYSPNNSNLANRKPIFLQHGSLRNSDLFVLLGKSSMAMRLSDMGYDVWLGNARGNFYTSSVNGENKEDSSYWNYSFDDMAIYDLPPIFELIANVTKKPGELIYVGHSAGTTEAMIYSIRMKSHAEKHIKAFIFIAPVVYNEDNWFMKLIKILVHLNRKTLGTRSKLSTKFCSLSGITWHICLFAIQSLFGPDNNNFLPEEMPLLLSAGDIGSLTPFNQFAETAGTDKFQSYRNSSESSIQNYNLGDIEIPTYLIVGTHDSLATYNNTLKIFDRLGSTHKKMYVIEDYNHMNYFYAKDLDVSFNPHFDDALNRIGKDGIIEHHGYPLEEYTVNSGNKFYLKIFRIPYSPINRNLTNRKPIFLQHGSLSNSDLFVLPGKSSMAMRLSDMGYDVWLGNTRGNFYTSSVNSEDKSEKSYWDFSLDDMAIYDLPPVFELIANVTEKPGELIYVGHSAATTEAMIYSIRMKAHAEQHIKAFIFVGPVAYLDETWFMKIIRILMNHGVYTLGERSKLPTEICSIDGLTWEICLDAINIIIGSDDNNFPPEQMPLLVSGGDIESLKPLNQFVQIADSNQFQAYKNDDESNPQIYDLGDIKIPTYLIVGKNDRLATYKNALRIVDELGSKNVHIMRSDMRQQLVIVVFFCTLQTVFSSINNVCNNYLSYGNRLISIHCSYNPDLFSTTEEIIKHHGYPFQEYKVNSGNRFYLRIFRIPFSPNNRNVTNRKPIFLQHGSLSNSDLFVLPGKSSMAMHLSDMGYDVWLGNTRGNFYTSSINNESRKNRSYWDFTMDDMAIYDLPPVLELIANVTKKPGELIYVAHSAGTTEGMIYSIREKEHAEKYIKAFIFVGPLAYIEDTAFIKILKILVKLGFDSIGSRSKLATEICSINLITWTTCIKAFNSIIGSDNKNFPPAEAPLLVSGADIESLKALNQFVQNAGTGQFRAYKYKGESSSRNYNLQDIKIPTYLIVGKNDILATYKNAVRVINELGSKQKKLYVIDNYNHMNYFYAKDLDVSFNPRLDDALDRIGQL
ncbi:PREDICTED: uncharacterized protein LOC108563159 [Nicrophorus vespilloides]|uniref:Uncharacterized protein LOC108563159 n=1 Tax=Nicrophorus vespilloides TaxID=110193 RepID=A0ABM1MRQ1_NICVS|nr:PREDICTED: uncharacterized protein LOC108563159 [Nicrophorus vespilloides]